MRTISRLVALVVAAALLTSLLIVVLAPAASAATRACRVRNVNSGVTTNSLRKAVRRARNGQRLTVRGTCHGKTVIGKNLVIKGIRARGTGVATLDANSKGRVLTIRWGARVTLVDLRLREGMASGPRGGGAILNLGTLKLKGTTAVVHSKSGDGGGGGVTNIGTLTLLGRSSIHHNFTDGDGGGVRNEGKLRLRASSSIYHNTTLGSGGGVANAEGATLTLWGSSSIRDNAGQPWDQFSFGHGGGIDNLGTVTLHNSSSVYGNQTNSGFGTDSIAGGIYNWGTLTLMDSSSVHDNSAEKEGGGIYADAHGTLVGVTCGGNVHDNDPDDCAP